MTRDEAIEDAIDYAYTVCGEFGSGGESDRRFRKNAFDMAVALGWSRERTEAYFEKKWRHL